MHSALRPILVRAAVSQAGYLRTLEIENKIGGCPDKKFVADGTSVRPENPCFDGGSAIASCIVPRNDEAAVGESGRR